MAGQRRFSNAARRHPLTRSLAWTFLFKAVALTALYFAFFAPHRVAVTQNRVAAAFGMPASERH